MSIHTDRHRQTDRQDRQTRHTHTHTHTHTITDREREREEGGTTLKPCKATILCPKAADTCADHNNDKLYFREDVKLHRQRTGESSGISSRNETGTIVFPLNVNVKREKNTRRRNLERKQFRRN